MPLLHVHVSDASLVRFTSAVSSDGTKGGEHKLKYKKFHLNIRKDFFIVILIKSCNLSLEL